LEIKVIGIRQGSRRHDLEMSSAWILNAETRDVVWTLWDAESERVTDDLREYKDEVELRKGTYEVYYSTFPNYEGGSDWGDWFKRDYDYNDFRRASRKFMVQVTGSGRELSSSDISAFHEKLRKDVLISVTELERNRYEKFSLTLDRDLDLQIYAIGEANKEGNYDASWIIDTRTNRKVWEFNYRRTEHAGGARKNRVYKNTISLPKGSYAVFVVSDDSHHFDDWNRRPPDDPFFWGLTIQLEDPKMARYAKVGEYTEPTMENVVVEFIRMSNNEFESKGFAVKKATEFRIYAIGEGRKGDMYDYSWIVDANRREVVWEMEYRKTEHAGGGEKNRAYDDVITLEKGNYIAYTATDGSHSYRDWNTAAPHDKDRWGLTLMVLNKGDMKNIAAYEEEADKNIVASIVKIGNNAIRNERFELEKDANVRIYALGEGTNGRMYDYAWIENSETGRVVWEMTYRRTDHAGGAKKNRSYNDTITLEKGKYVVYYESDGSHSFKRWNASPPRDMWNWGVTITLANGK
ncbi:MAG: hypothetical protein O7D32_09580, partial [bacterium]|nr:hypothetical protein [bacterium]